jgi:predicted nucleotidyltransferase
VQIGIDTSMTEQLAAGFRGRKVAFAYLFGSQTTGRVGPLSDIDIAVGFDESVASEERFALRLQVQGELGDLFKTDNVDVVVLNDAPPLLAHRVVKEGRLLFCADHKGRLAFETTAVLKYLDWKPLIDKYTRQTLDSGAKHGR